MLGDCLPESRRANELEQELFIAASTIERLESIIEFMQTDIQDDCIPFAPDKHKRRKQTLKRPRAPTEPSPYAKHHRSVYALQKEQLTNATPMFKIGDRVVREKCRKYCKLYGVVTNVIRQHPFHYRAWDKRRNPTDWIAGDMHYIKNDVIGEYTVFDTTIQWGILYTLRELGSDTDTCVPTPEVYLKKLTR